MKWFRFYHEFVDDPKIAMMSDSDQLLWVKALCLASDSAVRGVIMLTDEEICWKLRITVESWKHAVDKFRAKGMVEHCEDGYRISNWDKRQFASDSSAERVAKHRAEKAGKPPKQPKPKKPKVTVTQSVETCNVTVTPSDPDPDPDPYSEQSIEEIPPTPQGEKCATDDSEAITVEAAVVASCAPEQQPGDLSKADTPHGIKSSAAARPTKKRDAIVVDVVAWVTSHNQHKPDGWAGCRKLSPQDVEAVKAVIEFYDYDQALALESHALALQAVRTDPRLKWWRDKSGGFITAIYKTKIGERIGAWAEAARAKGLNPDAVAASGMSEQDIKLAEFAAEVEKLRRRQAERRSISA